MQQPSKSAPIDNSPSSAYLLLAIKYSRGKSASLNNDLGKIKRR